MTDPGAPRIVTLLPAIWRGRNCELGVKPKVVVPENVTMVPGNKSVSRMALLEGAWMLCRVRDVHAAAATAGEICEYAVQRHGVVVVAVGEVVARDWE